MRKEAETNKELKVKRQKQLRCSICPPNKGENAMRKAKHGKGKPKYKDRRRGKA